MLVDHFLDLEDAGGHLWLRAWRCVNCGEVLEPVTAERRALHETVLARLRDRWTKRPSAGHEAVPIGI